MDSLADLALVQDQIHEHLMDMTPTPSPDLEALWKEAHATIASALNENVLGAELDSVPFFVIPANTFTTWTDFYR